MNNFLRRITFSLWYLSNPPWDSGISPPELLDFIKNHPPGNAIDIGCGTGTNVITLAQAGWQVTGVDFVPRAIRVAKRKAQTAGIRAELLVRDAADLTGIRGPFDLALDMGCFHGLGNKKAGYLSELDRILAPGGHWLMYGFLNTALSLPAPVERTRSRSRGPCGSGPRTKGDAAAQSTPGLAEADLERISASMTLVWRQDGFDRGQQTSAWFLFQKT